VSRPPRAVIVVGLLALMTIFGLTAVLGTPPGGRAIGIWPSALATAAFLFSSTALRPLLVPVGAVLSIGTVWWGGRPGDVAWGWASD
jgi:hypothetical protein